MRKIILILLLLLLLAGCKEEVVQPQKQIIIENPAKIGISLEEKTIHNYIISAEPKGKFIVLDLEIANIGEETITLTAEDVKLEDSEGNIYKVDSATLIYSDNKFPFEKIYSNDKVSGKLVFDVPNPEAKFTLTIKEKSITI